MSMSGVRFAARQVALAAVSLSLVACGRASVEPEVRLSALRPLQTTPDIEMVPLRIAVAAVISPRGTVESYRPLIDYISKKTGRPVTLVQRRTYAEVNQLVEDGQVDLAFVCTSAYVEGHDAFDMQLIAAPQVNGQTVYHSVLVVPSSSKARSMSDLRGKVFAFTDPMSLTGRVYPASRVNDLGSTPERFFGRTYFTYSHDDAIRAVADGVADGAMVDSLVYEYAVARDPALGRRTQVVERSPAFGIPPVVVGPDVRPQMKAELRGLLLDISRDEDPSAAAALQSIGVERFVTIDDGAYATVRELFKRMEPIMKSGQ